MTRARWIAAASIAAGVAVLALLVAFTPWSLLAARVSTVPWTGWLAATLGMSATYALRAGRLQAEWRWKLRPLGLGYRECLQVTLLHNAAINVLPMRSGEASYAFLLHRRWGVGLGDAAASLLWLRLQDMMVLGVLGLAILVPAPPAWRLGFAAAAIAAAATLLPALVRRVHVHARWSRGRLHAVAASRGRHRFWHLVAKVAGAFRAARGGARAWGFAIANWVLKLGIVGLLLASLANLSLGAAFCGALGGELAAVIPLQAPAGVGTYEAGVAVGTRARPARPAARAPASMPMPDHPPGDTSARAPVRTPDGTPATAPGHPASDTAAVPSAANTDNPRLVFGAALAVHALMVVVALATALAFSLIVRSSRAPESST